jgi:hypothetical protein
VPNARPLEKDLYSILGVEPTATAEKIHEAYRSRARISHPDRFNKETQPRDWKIANEMLKDLNLAYATLRDSLSRDEYDRRRANEQAPQRPKKEEHNRGATEPGIASPNSVRFEDVPPSLQDRMLERQKNIKLDQFQVSNDNLFWNFAILCFLICWFVYLIISADGAKWTATVNLWQGVATLIVGWLIAGQIATIVRWFKSNLKPFFYITPLYYIKTDHDIITYWPIFALQDMSVTHNYRNGRYENSTVILKFEGRSETLLVPNQRQMEDLFARLKSYDARLRKAQAADDDNYFTLNDDFAGLPRTGKPVADSKLSKETTWAIRGGALATCLATYFCFVALNDKLSSQKWVEHVTPSAAANAPVVSPKPFPRPPIPQQSVLTKITS